MVDLKFCFHLVFSSQIYDQICYSDIQKILESSQRYNLQNNITSLLIYRGHHFIQILEGEEKSVMETMARIIQDRRIHHLRVVVESQSNQRIFEKWPMVFHDGDIDKSTSGLVESIFATALDESNKEKESILQMFQCFRRSSSLFYEA